MYSLKSGLIGLSALLLLAGCGQSADAPSADSKAAAATATAAAGSTSKCDLVSTKDNSPLNIKVEADDTPEAKEFLATCINPYTKRFKDDPELAKQGQKVFNLYSCTQCHGPHGDGQVAVAITDDRWQYAKHVTDKGMFETIAGGTNGGMNTWHKQVSGNPDLVSTDEILKVIGWLRTQYKGGGDTPWYN